MTETFVTEREVAIALPEGAAAQGLAAQAAAPVSNGQVGLWALLGVVTMLFAGFTSAYLVRRASPDWQPIYSPPILWWNTVALVLSSATLVIAQATHRLGQSAKAKLWLLATGGLGGVFLVGQWLAWQELVTHGIHLPSSPHSSFFYMLTGVHGLHLLGGLLALAYASAQVWRSARTLHSGNTLSLCAVYWHYLTGIWLFLYFLLFVWR
ncbi:MAG: cytochrome c oxidase subunit 3 [Acidobacteria bacterium]|nr:cytochrome c oxidase subunit 3 [Acidobacteriota bacterium]